MSCCSGLKAWIEYSRRYLVNLLVAYLLALLTLFLLLSVVISIASIIESLYYQAYVKRQIKNERLIEYKVLNDIEEDVDKKMKEVSNCSAFKNILKDNVTLKRGSNTMKTIVQNDFTIKTE